MIGFPESLTSRAEFEVVIRQGRTVVLGEWIRSFWLLQPLATSRVGFVIRRRFLKAVQRSRFKRVMRVLVYQVSQSLDCPVWCVFMVTQKVMPEEWKIFDRAGQAGRKAWVKKVLNSLIVQNEI